MNYFNQDSLMASANSDANGQINEPTRLNISAPQFDEPVARPRIVVLGVGGAGGNAVNNMIQAKLEGVEFVVANTDAQALRKNLAPKKIQLGGALTEGLGAGADPETGRAAAEESIDELLASLDGTHMVFITAGMGGGTGTGAAPEIAKELKASGILTVGVVTRPFDFEGLNRKQVADSGITELEKNVDTLIVIPNQHLFRIASDKALFSDAMKMADEVLYNGVRAISDLITGSGTWNLDLADVRTLMTGMGKAMMGTGEAEGEDRALRAAEIAISNPLLEDMDLSTAKGMLINIAAGEDLTFYEVEAAASRVKAEIPLDASIIVGQCNNPELAGRLRVSVVATGLEQKSTHMAAQSTGFDAGTPSMGEAPMHKQSMHTQSMQPQPMTVPSYQAMPEPAYAAEPAPMMHEQAVGSPMPTAHGEPSLTSGVQDQPAAALPPAYEQPGMVSARPVAAPAMPRHRDAQFTQDLAQPMPQAPAPAPTMATAPAAAPAVSSATQASATAPEPVEMTAYERALAEARQKAASGLPTFQSVAQSDFAQTPMASAETTQTPSQESVRPLSRPGFETEGWAQPTPNNAPQDQNAGLFGKMRDMVSKAARSQNRAEASNGLSQFAAPHFTDQDPPLGPTTPGGGHAAPAHTQEGLGYQAAPAAQAMAPASLHPAEQMAQATDNRIRAITSQPMVDDSEDDLLVDIPAFLRRQYN